MVTEQLDEKFTQTELTSLKNEVTDLREQERIKQDQIQGLQHKVHIPLQGTVNETDKRPLLPTSCSASDPILVPGARQT